jgi:DNA-binding MarR family transcriptional regulator
MARAMTDAPESEAFRLADSPSHLLHRAEQLASDRFTFLVGEGVVTLRQFAVLAAIGENPGLSQAELVRVTGIDRSTLADMVSRMDRRGWISRSESITDKRAHAVRLVPAGEQMLHNATQSAKAADAAILDALPRTKRKAFLNTLTKLAKLSDEAAVKAEQDAKRLAKREADHAKDSKKKRDGKERR